MRSASCLSFVQFHKVKRQQTLKRLDVRSGQRFKSLNSSWIMSESPSDPLCSQKRVSWSSLIKSWLNVRFAFVVLKETNSLWCTAGNAFEPAGYGDSSVGSRCSSKPRCEHERIRAASAHLQSCRDSNKLCTTLWNSFCCESNERNGQQDFNSFHHLQGVALSTFFIDILHFSLLQ